MIELTTNFILSQIFMFGALVFDFLAFQFKERKKMFLCLIVSTSFIALHYFFFNKIAAAVILLLSVLRFIVGYYSTDKKFLYIFIVLNTISLLFTYKEVYDLIIYVGTVIFIIGMFQENSVLMRKIMMISMVLAVIYNIIIFSPMGMLVESSVLVSNIIGYYRHHTPKENPAF